MKRSRDRQRALQELLELGPGLESAVDEVSRLAPSLDGPPTVLSRVTVRAALDAFARGDLPAPLLERWAEALHTAEDVELASRDRVFLADALFQLSTPELFGPMEEIVAGLLVQASEAADLSSRDA